MAFVKPWLENRGNLRGLNKGTDADWMFVPPFTSRVVLTDRADGTLWLLTFNVEEPSEDGLGYISIDSVLPERPDRGNLRVFGSYDGPVIRWVTSPAEHSQGPSDPKPQVAARLLVRDGYLGFEVVSEGASYGRTMARKRVQRVGREIVRPATYADTGPFNVLGWRVMEF